jgi:hypothetical protein
METGRGPSPGDRWAGLWVLVQDGNVVAAAPGLSKLAGVRPGQAPVTYRDPGPAEQIIVDG